MPIYNLFQNTFKSQGETVDQNALHLPKPLITSILKSLHQFAGFGCATIPTLGYTHSHDWKGEYFNQLFIRMTSDIERERV